MIKKQFKFTDGKLQPSEDFNFLSDRYGIIEI